MPISQFRIFQSTDAGAPVLSGLSGSFVNVLNKILVTGYGGSGSAGWTADYTSSATSGSTFRMPSGSRCYLSVDDVGVVTTSEARIRGFEEANSYNTGGGPFPSIGQGINSLGYLSFRKSATTNSTARAWIAFVDAYGLYFFAVTGDPGNFYQGELVFGDYYTLGETYNVDPCKCFIYCRGSENNANGGSFDALAASPLSAGTQLGHFAARSYGGYSGSIAIGKIGNYSATGGNFNGSLTYPQPHNGGMLLNRLYLFDAGGKMRGVLRGLYQTPHAASNFTDKDTIAGSGSYYGKTWQVVKFSSNANTYFIEISNTLET